MKKNPSYLELTDDQPEWAETGTQNRVLIAGINIPGYYSLPIRILSLLASQSTKLKDHYDFRFVEWDMNDDQGKWLDRIISWKPDILGLSVNIWNRNQSFYLAQKIKKHNPQTCIITGGQEMTGSVIDYLNEVPALDYAIDGEGEIPFLHFLQDWNPGTRRPNNPSKISGLHYRDQETTKFSSPAQVVSSLEEIPSVILAGLVPPDKKMLGALLEGARGCPFKCSFCFEGAKTCKVRMTSVQRIQQEVKYMAEMGATHLHMLDPILCNGKITRLRKISDIFKRLKKQYDYIQTSVEAYGDQINVEVAQCLDVFSIVDIGLQSIHPPTLKEINRSFSPSKFIRGIELLRQTNATINIYLIIGLPHETIDSFIRGICFVLEQKPTRIFVNELCLLNGTELRQRAQEYGYEFDADPPYHVRSGNWMTFFEMDFLRLLAKEIEKVHNLCFRSRFSVPWSSQANLDASGIIRIYLNQGCETGCPGCQIHEAQTEQPQGLSQLLDAASGKTVEIITGSGTTIKELNRLAAKFQLSGAEKVRLVCPPALLTDRDDVERLVNAGFWYFRTFYFAPNPEIALKDSKELQASEELTSALQNLDRLITLRGERGDIHPHVELVVTTQSSKPMSNKPNKDAFNEIIDTFGKQVSSLAFPGLFLNDGSKAGARIKRYFEKATQAGCWLKIPASAMKHLLVHTREPDDVVSNLESLDLICIEKNTPPCFKAV